MAVTSDIEVANQALGYVGQRAGLTSLNDSSTEARLCRTYLPTAKRAMLECFEWRWATRRQALALVAGATRIGYAYVHALPSNITSIDGVRRIETGGRPTTPEWEPPYLLELNDVGNGFIIASDIERPVLVYTVDVPFALWPSKAIDAIALDLAWRLALSLPVKPQVAMGLRTQAAFALNEAKASHLNSEVPDTAPDAESVRVRSTPRRVPLVK